MKGYARKERGGELLNVVGRSSLEEDENPINKNKEENTAPGISKI